jgi:phenylacetaldehyde dehydrogenase
MTVTLDRNVEQFIGASRQLFINGQWVDAASGQTFATPSPATGETLANIAEGDTEDGAVEGAANAIFFNHGRCCVAGSRLFVQQSRFDEVVDGVAEIARSIKLGSGMEPGTQMGPLVSDEQLRRVTGYLESGKADGATAVTGGGRFGDRGYFVEPAVITNATPDMIVREEIFGPVVVASPFSDLDEIAAQANDTDYGLGGGIWTRDVSKAHALAKKIRACTVWINCYNVFDASLPFGGYKQSGWGREMGHEVLEAYTEVKAVTTQL